jgi:hypothetical protein
MLYDVLVRDGDTIGDVWATDLVTGCRRYALDRARRLSRAMIVRVIDNRGQLYDFMA